MTSLKNFAFQTALALSFAAASVACGGSSEGAKSAADVASEGGSGHAEVGKPAPDLSIRTLNGKGTVSLASLAGKTVIVDFWATWCGPCKKSFPKLEELQKRLGTEVVIVGVSVDDEDSGVLDFAKENGATFPIGWDEGHTLANRWKVSTMPTSFLVDPSGVVRYVHAGYHDDEPEKIAKEATELSSNRGSAMAKSAPEKSAPVEAAPAPEPPSAATSTNEPPAAAAADEPERAPVAKPKKAKKAKSTKKSVKKKA